MFEAPDIPGAADVIAWFGYWPTFHDSEVLSIHLNRSGESQVVLYAFEMTPEVDSQGHYILAKHVIVTFTLTGFPLTQYGNTDTRIECFNYQNMLSSVSVNQKEDYYELELAGNFGANCLIVCDQMSVKIKPGRPPDDIE
jgi:hypothetical protein